MKRRAIVLASTSLLVAGCARPSSTVEAQARGAARPAETSPLARWIAPSAVPIDATDGVARVIVDGRRLDVRGFEIVGAAAPLPELDGGAKLPAWAARSDLGFVFWRRDAIYGAPTFDGPLRPLGRVRGKVSSAFPWLSGVGLSLGGATALVDGGGRVASFGAPATTYAIAIDARHAARLDVLGDVRFTADAGATWRDVSLGGRAARVFRRGDVIAVDVDDGTRELDARGDLLQGPLRSLEPVVDAGERWPGGRRGAVAALASSGAPLGDGGAVIAGDGHVGRIDLSTLRTTSIAALPGVDESTPCEPFHAKDTWLVVCQSESEAMVFDVNGEPRLERTFSRLIEDVDRFIVADEIGAIGFVGACDGRDVPLARDTSDRGFPPGSPAFCVRGAGGGWVEHTLSHDEASELIAWVPRAAGAATALLAPPAAKLAPPAVAQRGDLRVVRVARDVPPAPFASFSSRGAQLVDRAFTVDASGAIEGWLFVGSSPRTSVHVDPEGRVTVRPLPPRTEHVAAAGPVALAVTDAGAYHQSVDRGRTWTPTTPPPASFDAARLQCGPIGCVLGGLTRLGWDRATPSVVDAPLALPTETHNRAPRVEPVARLVCRGAEPPRSARQEEPIGFGVTRPGPASSSTVLPIHDVGAAIFPPIATLIPSADVEADLAWLAPLDVDARVRRTHLASAHLGVAPREIPYLGLSVAPLLRADGDVDLLAAHPSDACFDTVLEAAGIVRRGFGCLGREAMGVEIGKRIWLGDPRGNTLSISTHALERGAPATPAIDVTTRSGSGRWFGFGSRANAPVAVFVDLDGGAILAPIDATSGTLGHEEPLRSLAALELATSPGCSAGARDAARVLLAFEGAIAIEARDVAGVSPADDRGLAVIRWSREHACLEAVRLPIRDERVDPDPNGNAGPAGQRRLIGRFAGRGGARATLVDIGPGVELRQSFACDRVEPR